LWRSRTRRDQLFFGALAVVLLGASAVMQNALGQRRAAWNLVRETPESEKSYRSLAINFPRLTLGGFRGILSTVLWQQAEEDKTDRKWLDLETKYDIIGALQPYFVSVYVFHAWNQAYNLSAQWQEQDTKYKWVLDGLSYLYKGEDYNPGEAQLYLEEGHLYFMKLGGAYERIFYRAHWRDDISRLHELNDNRRTESDATVALQHVRQFINHADPRNGNKYFKVEELPDPEKRTAGVGWGVQITDPELFKFRQDGKKPGDPMEFRWGLSPFYFAFCEYKRCLGASGPQMLGKQTFDAWPAMSLRMWCRDDMYYTGQLMNAMFGKAPVPALLEGANLNRRRAEVLTCARNIQMIGPRAIELFNEHLGRFPRNEAVHRKHILETQAFIDGSKAESKLFETLVQWHLGGRKMTPELRASFLQARDLYQTASKTTLKWVDNLYPPVEGQPADPNRADNEKFVFGLEARAKGIEGILSAGPTDQPDMAFLADEVVER
jgi:hypothetical protein